MKKNYSLIVLSLLISLFIYVFYRTEKTVINAMFIPFVSCDNFIQWRQYVSYYLPLNEIIIYSLPGGLWVFSITLTSKFLYFYIGSRKFDLLFLPLISSIGLELFQLLHLTNGRFDFWDIGLSLLFWAIAARYFNNELKPQHIIKPFSENSLVCLVSYLVVYLAHVWKN
ncbi:MAG: hypothetical protein EOO10_18530 [Chitinophagaceae bacterium]|nr:MAG: hypothetical protein EOO10_18530 [Chitinophagaceae bacterium]